MERHYWHVVVEFVRAIMKLFKKAFSSFFKKCGEIMYVFEVAVSTHIFL